jgi:2-polyprenyl-6-methoxyphenol hydroxylase-like FAD-dependent oxidoreductase
MARQRHAEIAGAGIGGLTAATALTQRGWSVRVHERAPHLRDIGVGTTVWQNGLRVLESIGALNEVMSCGTKISQLEILDERQHAVRLHKYNDTDDRALVVLRVDLHRALVNAARKVGVEILTSSPAAAADPDGALILENGDRFSADLVVGCDGFYSNIRESLDLAEEVGSVTEAYIGRVIVPRPRRTEFETIQDCWAGSRRLGVLSCKDDCYLFMSAPENCLYNAEEVRSRSLFKPVWIEAFPFLADKLQQADGEVIWGRYPIVRCRRWSSGLAAILGDAAHAMPPTLAQGAGCAMVNALALAEAVNSNTDIPSALADWERRERPVTEITQRWAVLYTTIAKRWPDALGPLRSEIVASAFASPNLVSHFTTVVRHVVHTS